MQQLARSPQTGSAQVLARFGVRLIVLTAFATFGSVGFGQSMVALLWMSILLSAVIGGVRREQPLASRLNHWDEVAAYGALCALLNALNPYL